MAIGGRAAVLLSVVCVVTDYADELEGALVDAAAWLAGVCEDFELVVVDNASTDDSVAELARIAHEGAVPNLQVYTLGERVNRDVAWWFGIERALGDVFVTFDPGLDDISVVEEMLELAREGADVVYARNRNVTKEKWSYRLARWSFDRIYEAIGRVDATKDAPAFRLLSRRVIAFVGQQVNPALAYRLLPADRGFIKRYVTFDKVPSRQGSAGFWAAVDHGLRIIIGRTSLPLRVANLAALLGALMSLTFAAYVVVLSILRNNLAPGWASLALMNTSMFFLLSMVLLILGEYVLHAANVAGGGRRIYVTREFTSSRMELRSRRNVQESGAEGFESTGR